MSGRFKEYNPDQICLFAAFLNEWLPQNHLAYFVFDVLDQLDLPLIMKLYKEGSRRGQPAYHPAMMVKLLLYWTAPWNETVKYVTLVTLRGGVTSGK